MKKFVFISVTLFVLIGYLPFSCKQKQVKQDIIAFIRLWTVNNTKAPLSTKAELCRLFVLD
jgi:hypothetical protein